MLSSVFVTLTPHCLSFDIFLLAKSNAATFLQQMTHYELPRT